MAAGLLTGWTVRNGTCVHDSASDSSPEEGSSPYFLRSIISGSEDGLMAGKETDVQLSFQDTAAGNYDESESGVKIPPGGKLMLNFGPQFLYNKKHSLRPLQASVANLLAVPSNSPEPVTSPDFLQPCPYGAAAIKPFAGCTNWISTFGSNRNQVVFNMLNNVHQNAPVEVGAAEVRSLTQGSVFYTNAKGVCSEDITSYCATDDDCAATDFCLVEKHAVGVGTITAVIMDGAGQVVHMESRKVPFETASSPHALMSSLNMDTNNYRVDQFHRRDTSVCTVPNPVGVTLINSCFALPLLKMYEQPSAAPSAMPSDSPSATPSAMPSSAPTENALPEAKDDSATTDEDTPVNINVLIDNGNGPDSDPLNDPLTTAGVVSGPSNGTTKLKGDGTIDYIPNVNFYGQDSFEYRISDGKGGTDIATGTFVNG